MKIIPMVYAELHESINCNLKGLKKYHKHLSKYNQFYQAIDKWYIKHYNRTIEDSDTFFDFFYDMLPCPYFAKAFVYYKNGRLKPHLAILSNINRNILNPQRFYEDLNEVL